MVVGGILGIVVVVIVVITVIAVVAVVIVREAEEENSKSNNNSCSSSSLASSYTAAGFYHLTIHGLPFGFEALSHIPVMVIARTTQRIASRESPFLLHHDAYTSGPTSCLLCL